MESLFHLKVDGNLIVENIIQNKIGIMISVNVSVKNGKKLRIWKQNDAWNPNIYVYNCGKDCEIGEYLKDCTCIKSLVGDLVVTCDEILDKPETISVNPNDETYCWANDVVLLAIECLWLLVVIIVGGQVLHETLINADYQISMEMRLVSKIVQTTFWITQPTSKILIQTTSS